MEIDLQGNILERTSITFGMDDWLPLRFYISSDDAFYLSTITNIPTAPESHLIKMNTDFNIIWDKALDNKPRDFLYNIRDMKVLLNGQILILMHDYMESLDRNGNFMWNETLKTNPNRILVSLSIDNESSVCVFSEFYTPHFIESGALLVTFDLNGGVRWNKTLVSNAQLDIDHNIVL